MSDEIMLKFIFSNDNYTSLKCHKKENLRNMIDTFCKMKKIKLDHIILLHNGVIVNKYDININIEKFASMSNYQRVVFQLLLLSGIYL